MARSTVSSPLKLPPPPEAYGSPLADQYIPSPIKILPVTVTFELNATGLAPLNVGDIISTH